MCFYNNVKDVENKYSSILHEQIFTLQLNVIVLEPLNQSKSRIKEIILKINDFILCNCFLILIFFYINRVLREILLICKIKNHLQLLERIYKRKEGIADAYKVDEIDVDSYFFYNFLDICVQNDRIIRFSKGFEYATFSIKKFNYDDYITKQSFELSSELHINKYEILFILNSVPEILEQCRNLAQANCIPIPDHIAITSSVQSALFFHYYTDYNSEGVKILFGIRLPNTYIQKFCSKNGILSEIELKFNEVEQLYQSLTFLVNYVTSFPLSYPYLVNM